MSDATGSFCAVYVYREGALSAVGHDLELFVTGFTLEIGAGPSVRASARTDSLRVSGVLRGGVVGVAGGVGMVDDGEPSPRDRRDIERNVARDVLEADRYPVATFHSTRVEAVDGGYRIAGRLDLHGVVREVTMTAERRGERTVARFTLNQPDFRIKPFRALMGALRVKPEVVVEVSAASRASEGGPSR